jgi:hypothetical protein
MPYSDSLFSGGINNFLGHLGDAFLVQSGRPPMYSIRNKTEQIGQALQNYGTDPLGTIKAVNAIDPSTGMKLYQQYQTDQRDNILADRQKTLLDKEISGEQDKVGTRIGAIIQTLNPANYAVGKPMIESYAKSHSYDLPVPLPDEYDPNIIKLYSGLGLDPNKVNAIDEQHDYHQGLLNNDQARTGAYTSNLADEAKDRDISTTSNQNYRANQVRDMLVKQQQGQEKIDKAGGRRIAPNIATGTSNTGIPGNPPPPTRIGQRISNGSVTLVSHDGKTWSKE